MALTLKKPYQNKPASSLKELCGLLAHGKLVGQLQALCGQECPAQLWQESLSDPDVSSVTCFSPQSLSPLLSRSCFHNMKEVHLCKKPRHTLGRSFVCIKLHIYLSIFYPFTHPYICPSIHASSHPSVHLPTQLSVYRSPLFHTPIHTPIHPSTIHQFSICPFIHPSTYQSIIYSSIHPSIHLPSICRCSQPQCLGTPCLPTVDLSITLVKDSCLFSSLVTVQGNRGGILRLAPVRRFLAQFIFCTLRNSFFKSVAMCSEV